MLVIVLAQQLVLSPVIVSNMIHMILELLAADRLFQNQTLIKILVYLLELPFKCVLPNIILHIVAFLTGTLKVVLVNHGAVDPVTAAFFAVILHVMHLLKL